ncbi:MAG: hypothetical protein EA380_04695 [Phycisphaeraceae bacterium]|nr:MAG: hypothetical protein EA380_04695 [Phycisphaeraceae bacterium]
MEKTVLERPVLCLSGWRAWPVMSWSMSRTLSSMTGADEEWFGGCSFATVGSFEGAVRRVMGVVRERWGDVGQELDVVAVSMGGLVARAAAVGLYGGGDVLRVKRLFTLSSPHRGAKLAGLVAIDGASRDMRAGSEFLERLDEAERERGGRGYEMICYGRTRDWWVGARQSAPEDMEPIWLDPPPITMSHLLVTMDRRILGDIAARLTGNEPVLSCNGAPLKD